MARALRRVSVERGVDPRDVALIAFGGGGPLHACGLAERLGVRRIVVPPHAGVLSAVGLALAPERRESVSSLVMQSAQLIASALTQRLHAESARLGAGRLAEMHARAWVRARYEGQGYELDVPLSDGDDGAAIASRFASMHHQRTGFTLERAVECVSMRTVVGRAPWPVHFARPGRPDDVEVPSVDIDDGLSLDRTLSGPCVVRLADATLRVADGWTARALPVGGWLMETT
jgi:N-methylhydantoinase A